MGIGRLFETKIRDQWAGVAAYLRDALDRLETGELQFTVTGGRSNSTFSNGESRGERRTRR
ncbi:hypothetical protein C440_11638 [Haloferax mucosum ATCC BAA-1512]|uniref:Uncharacterized protein n=1 Tax=Haloferax mucosum ATCC BAA-1512 TaxID=662479 RepID=M0IBX7_9EURY|nr:hypothetical protein C440_11638 [Haloferax mucosum ATCC BAA-1512]